MSQQLSATIFRAGVAIAILATVLSLGMTFRMAQLVARSAGCGWSSRWWV